ncbi:hypothetical protein SLE2022_297060 [Rubroshorea leprosula]
MSEEELRIREELECEIERDLEEEIKDGIYHYALRLHRLYQHKMERHAITGECKTLYEVNICIRMEAGIKIEIKEKTKKEAPEKGRLTTSARSLNAQTFNANKKFDWARSLRSGAGSHPVVVNKKSERMHGAAKTVSGNNKVLQLGWK